MYETICKCPVCGVEMGKVTHPNEFMDGMIKSMFFQPYREDHASKSPQCMAHESWSRGWNTETNFIEE